MSNEEQDAPKGLTTVEMAYIKAIFRHSKARIAADWDKVAEEVGVKDAKCARERFRQISVKHSFGGQDGSPKKAAAGDSPNKVTKKRAPRAKKAKKEESEPLAATVEDASASEILSMG